MKPRLLFIYSMTLALLASGRSHAAMISKTNQEIRQPLAALEGAGRYSDSMTSGGAGQADDQVMEMAKKKKKKKKKKAAVTRPS
jgi:hypothetical protein